MIRISQAAEISPFNILNRRTCVLSESKLSNVSFVLCEELLRNGIPFCVVDTKGDLKSLKIMYELLWLGRDKSDADMRYADFKKLSEEAVTSSIPIIFDVSEVSDSSKYVEDFMTSILKAAISHRRPYLLIINDAERYVPEEGAGIQALKDISMLKPGSGLGTVMLSENPSKMDRNIIRQCTNGIIGRVTKPENLKTVRRFENENESELPSLNDNEFFMLGGFGQTSKIILRRRIINEKLALEREIFSSLKIKNLAAKIRKEKVFGTERIKERITKDESKEKVKLKKRYVLFGDEIEDFKSINRVYKKVVQASVDDDGREFTILLNPETGVPYSYDNTLREMKEYEQVARLNEDEAKIMRLLSEGQSTKQILKERTGMNPEALSAALRNLMDRNKVIRSEDEQGNELFSVSNEFPLIRGLAGLDSRIIGESTPLSETADINEKNAVKLIKAISPGAEVKELKMIIYPFYRLEIAGQNPRTAIVDAVTGVKL